MTSRVFYRSICGFRSHPVHGRHIVFAALASSSPNRRGCTPTALIIGITLPFIRVWGSSRRRPGKNRMLAQSA
ncbi:MAG: hypothetical protein KKA10_16205 [Euryarchaeota archaeon]|nr:hypothetical protein [Euryarchaeota archaeon]